jgi:hypothetical protein
MNRSVFRLLSFFVCLGVSFSLLSATVFADTADDIREDELRHEQETEDIRHDEQQRQWRKEDVERHEQQLENIRSDYDTQRIRQEEIEKQQRRLHPDNS